MRLMPGIKLGDCKTETEYFMYVLCAFSLAWTLLYPINHIGKNTGVLLSHVRHCQYLPEIPAALNA